MIFVSHALPVNVAGEPQLDRAAVWDGLVLKANNALPFVSARSPTRSRARTTTSSSASALRWSWRGSREARPGSGSTRTR